MSDEFDLRELSLDRRSFLRRGAAGGAGLALLGTGGMSAFLAACGSSSKPAVVGIFDDGRRAAKDLGELTFQLSWIKNVEFAGEYIADTNGYYKDAGLLEGQPARRAARTSQQDAVVAVGQGVRRASPRPTSRARRINNGRRAHHHRRAVPEEPVLRDEPGEQPDQDARRT